MQGRADRTTPNSKYMSLYDCIVVQESLGPRRVYPVLRQPCNVASGRSTFPTKSLSFLQNAFPETYLFHAGIWRRETEFSCTSFAQPSFPRRLGDLPVRPPRHDPSYRRLMQTLCGGLVKFLTRAASRRDLSVAVLYNGREHSETL